MLCTYSVTKPLASAVTLARVVMCAECALPSTSGVVVDKVDFHADNIAKTGSALLSVSGVVAGKGADNVADTSTGESADHLSGDCLNTLNPASGKPAAYDTFMDIDALLNDELVNQTPLKSAIYFLISEMRSLSKSNDDLHVLVRSLRDDNTKLVSEMDEMHVCLENLHKSLEHKTSATNSSNSPKYKKLRKNSTNNRIATSKLTPAAEPVVANNAESHLLSSSSNGNACFSYICIYCWRYTVYK